MVSYFDIYFKIMILFILCNIGKTSVGHYAQGLWEISIYQYKDFPQQRDSLTTLRPITL